MEEIFIRQNSDLKKDDSQENKKIVEKYGYLDKDPYS